MLLDGVNFDSGDEFERDGASPSPKKKPNACTKKEEGRGRGRGGKEDEE